ncbi:MAG: prolyl oligopeptidase family serine peptidase [Candidatus Eisenbacteria bacterium]
MNARTTPALVLAIAALITGLARAEEPARYAYPPTPVHAVSDTLHGDVIADPYRWLERADDPAVEAWTAAQNAFTLKTLGAWPGRAALTARYRQLFAIPTATSVGVYGKRVFVERKDGLQNQPVYEVHEGSWDAPAKVAIDPNAFPGDGTVALDWKFPSPDGALIAYGTSEGGSEHSTLYVRDVRTGKDLADAIPNTQAGSVAWDPGGGGFYYTRHPAKGEVPAGEEVFHQRVYHHRLGDAAKDDPVIWAGEGAPIQEFRTVYGSSDHAWVFLSVSTDWAKNDLYVRSAETQDPFRPVARGLEGRTDGDAAHGELFLRTNVGAERYRIVKVVPGAHDPAEWQLVVPEQKGVIEAFAIVGNRLVVHVSENAASSVRIFGLDGSLQREVPLPSLGTVSDLAGDPGGQELFFRFTSFADPSMIYRYDMTKDTLAPITRRKLPFDPARYESRQVWATSKDGTQVPMFLVHRKGLALDGKRPTILYGYGGFEVSLTPEFRAAVLPWLDAGGVWCSANLRGGGEFGRAWHEAGRLERKQNVFDDYYACAEWLIAHGVTSASRLAAHGGSNGGLLVGAAITQRPELWGAAVCEVPLLDMLRYQDFSIARYWVPEYGSSEDPLQYAFLRAYSPYQNVRPGTAYPPTLFTAGAADARVDALHARKMCALLQAEGAGGPFLLRVEDRAGHGQGKPTSKRIAAAADIYGFLMSRFDLMPTAPNP